MDDYLKEALEIVKAQAGVRNMSEEEITQMVQTLAGGIRTMAEAAQEVVPQEPQPPVDPRKAIREKSIICLESGKPYKVITKRHLAKYGLTPDEYRLKWGYPKNTPLVCKSLQRERRKKMKEMRLWERRGKNK
jgi:predicted transcriptional regulator